MIKVTGAQSGFKVCPYFQPNGGTSVGRLIFGTDDRSSTYKLDSMKPFTTTSDNSVRMFKNAHV